MDSYPPFILFGQAHVLALLSVAVLIFVIPLLVRRLEPRHGRRIGLVIAAVLVLNEISNFIVSVYVYDVPPGASLPLHLCGVAALLTAWMLWRRSYRAYEISWFWAMAGSIPALLTPDLAAGFPHPTFLHFFAGHGLIMLGALHATLVDGFRPVLRSMGKAILASLLLMLVITPVNLVLDTNYMYLCSKPGSATLMDYFGPWPWYIASLVLAGSVICFICYLPFALARIWFTQSNAEPGRGP
jgi:hypothetical integral membrane protein (TIGR02206 family)